ncbi:MAG: Ldh family oxidoreductase [Candidatus Bathyarchaeia archaeon]
MPIITSTQLALISQNLLKAAGASDEEAEIVTRFLVNANLAGVDSHGVVPNLTVYLQGLRSGTIKTRAKIEVRVDGPSTALIDGNWGFGQMACSKAMEIAIDKARKTGVGAVGIFNCNHIGRLAEYAQMAVDNGMIGFITANCEPYVAPYGGRTPVLGTNPLSYAIPAGHEKAVIVDYATSAAAEGKVRAALLKGEQLPSGWIVDAHGHPSTNPADLYEPPFPPERIKLAGALLPFGGYKGYGLGLVVDMLAGVLTGAGSSQDMASGWLTNGVFIMVLKIDNFVPLEDFKDRVDRLVKSIKNSPKAEGFEEILIPGEPEVNERERRLRNGIPISENAWQPLVQACKKYGIDVESLMRI